MKKGPHALPGLLENEGSSDLADRKEHRWEKNFQKKKTEEGLTAVLRRKEESMTPKPSKRRRSQVVGGAVVIGQSQRGGRKGKSS